MNFGTLFLRNCSFCTGIFYTTPRYPAVTATVINGSHTCWQCLKSVHMVQHRNQGSGIFMTLSTVN